MVLADLDSVYVALSQTPAVQQRTSSNPFGPAWSRLYQNYPSIFGGVGVVVITVISGVLFVACVVVIVFVSVFSPKTL